MPWKQDAVERPRGPLAMAVRVVFAAIELLVKLAMLPVRFVSAFAGRGVLYLVQLPVKVFRFLVQLIGLVLVVAIVVLVVVTLLALLAAA